MRYLEVFAFVFSFVLIQETISSRCPYTFKKRGCWIDVRYPVAERDLPDLLSTDRDTTSGLYSGHPIDWGNFPEYLASIACRCAELAYNLNHRYYGLEYWGECWSGESQLGGTYQRHGSGDGCYNGDYLQCDDTTDELCMGSAHRLFVYEIVYTEGCGCDIKYDTVGCWKDQRYNRILPNLIMTDRDRRSRVSSKINIDWGNWGNYLPELVCRCGRKAKELGYQYFGIEFWGECWAGSDNYTTHGIAEDCYNNKFELCDPRYDRDCAGEIWTMQVYEFVNLTCPITFERLGCFESARDSAGRRALPELILTDRDPTSAQYSNIDHNVGWRKFDIYLPDLACRAAMKAVSLGYDTYSLQFWAEAWSGPNANATYFRDGRDTECYDTCYEPCHSSSDICVGAANANFVYRITNGEECEVSKSTLGCFMGETDKFDTLIIDGLDPFADEFDGHYTDAYTDDWDSYLKALICRCSRKVKEQRLRYVAITETGLCYSSSNSQQQQFTASSDCYNRNATETPCSSDLCSGNPNSVYVYDLGEVPGE